MPCSIARLPVGVHEHFLCCLADELKRPVLYLFATDFEAKRAFENCHYSECVYIPSIQPEFAKIEVASRTAQIERIAAISQLSPGKIGFCSISSLLFKMRPELKTLKLSVGDIISPENLIAKLVELGYERVSLIDARGQFTARGEIAEIFAVSGDPVRINFFDDEIETLKFFDEQTQRSHSAAKTVEITQSALFLLNDTEKTELINYFRETNHLEKQSAEYISKIRDLGTFVNIEAFAGVFSKSVDLATLTDAVIVANDLPRILESHQKLCEERQKLFVDLLAAGSVSSAQNSYAFDAEQFFSDNRHKTINIEGLEPWLGTKIDAKIKTPATFRGDFPALKTAISERIKQKSRTFLYAGGKANALKTALLDNNLNLQITTDPTDTSIVAANLSGSFEAGGDLYLCTADIFGTQKTKRKLAGKTDLATLMGQLKPGDLVVHESHGKGRFVGITTMNVGGIEADYLELHYRGDDKLFINTQQIERVQKYIGSDGDDTRLDKLGGKEWELQKVRARASIAKLAEDLADIYSERASLSGFTFPPDDDWQRQFEDNFEYEQTPGQDESLTQIKRDMTSGRVMDRLLMGDVGYGKTEVAMCAAFKAVTASKQVAVLVPTTLLARQHYETFKARFTGFPVKIDVLSRFTKNPKNSVENVSNGRTDIIIGTHKLLSKDIKFRDLGLLIVDEEQRFGVLHKERIVDMKRGVDVLTLSATPIPRTMEMSLVGIKDISTIDTPPEGRIEVAAYVCEFSWAMVRDAVLAEKLRGGQVFFVTPRISSMPDLLTALNRNIPEVSVAVAHGQLPEDEFDKVVTDFYAHEYDVLLCTTIIESGIDIPNANTLIVYQADRFGLAQLYQLKGRVGRASVLAHAYFTHLGADRLNDQAAKRLISIREFTEFGSGVKIALRDLEIRGAGNILGPEQSGHIMKIGYNLYSKFFRQEIGGFAQKPDTETAVELGFDALIPQNYIPDESQKLDMYRAVGAINSAQNAESVRSEFADRFGAPPKQVQNLITAALIKSYAAKAGIASVIAKAGIFELKFEVGAKLDPIKLSQVLAHYNNVKLIPSNPPRINVKSSDLSALIELLAQVGGCA